MALFPLAETMTCRSLDPWSDCPAPVRARDRRTNVVWWWRTALPTIPLTDSLPTISSDHAFHSHHQARRSRTRPPARPASAARCIRRAAGRRNSRWTVAAIAERGPPSAASCFT
jgi:hypothetical protein